MTNKLYFLTTLLFLVVTGLEWNLDSLPDGAALYPCPGADLVLDWRVARAPGEQYMDVQWVYSGRDQQVLAVWAHGNMLATPAYSSRITLMGEISIRVANVTWAESGNYSVLITLTQNNGHSVSTSRTAVVIVGADPRKCGTGKMVATATESAMGARLALLEAKLAAVLQLSSTISDFQHIMQTEIVTSFESIREENNTTLKRLTEIQQTNDNITHKVSDLQQGQIDHASCLAEFKQENNQTLQKLAEVLQIQQNYNNISWTWLGRLAAENVALKEKAGALASADLWLSERVSALDARVTNASSSTDYSRVQVSFLARDIQNARPVNGEGLVFTKVLHNQGDGYSNVTGRFTAPLAGTYIVMATLQAFGEEGDIMYVMLTVDGEDVMQASTDLVHYADDDTTSLQAALVLHQGQQVWLRAKGDTTRVWDYPYANVFSAVLVTPQA